MPDNAASPGPWNVLVVGGAGYIGSRLVPRLLDAGHRVSVLDLFLYGSHVFGHHGALKKLRQTKGDLRNHISAGAALKECDAVIHLGGITDEASFNLDPTLGRAINNDYFRPMVRMARASGVKRFVYASCASVYGEVMGGEAVESMAPAPVTDFARSKALAEEVLLAERQAGFVPTILRLAPVCGYAARPRLDLLGNAETAQAVATRRISIAGGERPVSPIHVEDVVDLLLRVLESPDERIDGGIFNLGGETRTMMQMAALIRDTIDPDVAIEARPADGLVPPAVSSVRVAQALGFVPKHGLAEAVAELAQAVRDGRIADPLANPLYHNMRRIRQAGLH